MTVTLFYSPFCSPARSVLLIAKALKLKLKIVEVDLLSKNYKVSPFKKKHPEKTIPCLKDGNNYIWDSHAIAEYLVDLYGAQSRLLPKSSLQKAKVTRLLHFDTEYLIPLACDTLVPVLFQRKHVIPTALKNSVDDVYSILNEKLKKRDWLIGKSVTIADLCCISSITTLDLILPVEKNSKLFDYMQKFKELPYYQEGNQDGLNIVAEYIMKNIFSYKFGCSIH